jgi:hypothetical protein
LLEIPGVLGSARVPVAAHRQLAHREFRDQHRARLAEPLDDRCVMIGNLLAERRHPPRRANALGGEQVFGAPGNAMQWSAIAAGGDLAVGLRGLFERQLFGQIHDA